MGIFRKSDKRKNAQLLLDAYGECTKDPLKYLSDDFKGYIDRLLPEAPGHKLLFMLDNRNPPRVAMLSGYCLRCAEAEVGQHKAHEPDDKIKTLICSNLDGVDKITAIADYLDDHDKWGLQDKVSNYSLISFDATTTVVADIAEDVYQDRLGQVQSVRALEGQKMNKEEKREFRELIYRNVAYGYLFKVSEELVGTSV